MSSYIGDEADKSLENTMILVKKRNNGIERIIKKYDIYSRNRRNKDLKNLTLIKSDESFNSKIFRSRNSSYDKMSQDSNNNKKRYFNDIQIISKKKISCVDHIFPRFNYSKKTRYSFEIFDENFKRFFQSCMDEFEYLLLKVTLFHHFLPKEYFSIFWKKFKTISKIKRCIDKFSEIKSIIKIEDLCSISLINLINFWSDILSKSNFVRLQKIKKHPFFITNQINEINKILGNETLRKFFIRRIRDYIIKYIKENKFILLIKYKQQEEKEVIFIKEFIEKKQPPFEFSSGGAKKHYQSHSLDFLHFIISKKIIILICRVLRKESEDYLKILVQFNNYPNYYLKLKKSLSLL